jgi:mono/diheme cytochrome c family protein
MLAVIFNGTGAPRAIAVTIFVVVTLTWLLYIVFNFRKSRPETGAEIYLAANRKPYYDDDVLESKKLDRSLMWGFAFLLILAVGLPLYWLAEPSRQEGAIPYWDTKLARWGENDYATTAEGGFNCAGCHGGQGQGGVAAFTVTDPLTGEVSAVSWTAPALNTLFYKYSEAEVIYILNYGRPFSPMSPWGLIGGGPMNEQQITNIVEYLKTLQIPLDEAQGSLNQGLVDQLVPVEFQDAQEAENEDVTSSEVLDAWFAENPADRALLGEALFNNPVSAGSYSCARCHTKGWSYGDPQVPAGGWYGPNLTGGSEARQFPRIEDNIAFLAVGVEEGRRYGEGGQGNCCMPGFGSGAGPLSQGDGLYTDEQLRAVAEYIRGL